MLVSDDDGGYLNLNHAIRIQYGARDEYNQYRYTVEFVDGSKHGFSAREDDLETALGTIVPAAARRVCRYSACMEV